MKEKKEGRRYFISNIFTRVLGWLHIVLGIGGTILFFNTQEGTVKLLFTYMILLGIALVHFNKAINKLLKEMDEMDKKINNKN